MACTANKLCVHTELREALRCFLHLLRKPAPPLVVLSNIKATRARVAKAPLRVSCNSEFNITQVHPELCRLLGYEPNEMIGMSILGLMSPVVADAHAAMFRRLKRAGAGERCDSIVLDADRNPVPCRLTVQLRMDLSSELVFNEIQGKVSQSVPRGFGQYIRQEPGLHLVDEKDVACIMTDLANTTSLLQRVSRSSSPHESWRSYSTRSMSPQMQWLKEKLFHMSTSMKLLEIACYCSATLSSWVAFQVEQLQLASTSPARCRGDGNAGNTQGVPGLFFAMDSM
eukprot:s1707_g4.t1